MREGTEDRCPGVLRLHVAGDGGLARVRLPGGMLSADQLRGLGRAAAIGSDIVELTSRAGVQIRGLAAGAAGAIEQILTAAGLVPSASHDRVRNILASPVAGRHQRALAATDGVVVDLDRLICAAADLTDLPGRFVFEIDDGSGIGRAAVADVTLRATPPAPGGDAGFELVLGGVRTDLGDQSTGAARLGLAAARGFLELRTELGSDAWHVEDLPDGPAELARRLGARITAGDRRRAGEASAGRRPATVGVTEQLDGRTAICGLARLGRLDRRQLDGLAELCLAPGGIRVSPWKTITVVDVPAGDAGAVVAGLQALDLVVAPDSPWVGLSACAGVGGCASARIDVRGLAAGRAAGGRVGDTEHWSACERRCGEPADARISVAPVGGQIAVRIDGTDHIVDGPADAVSAVAAARPDAVSAVAAARR